MKIHQLLPSVLALTGAAALAPAVAQADAAQAMTVAAQHAGYAADQNALGGVRTHLHHVLNCLVGPDGEGFNRDAGNPCAQAGGAIPQTSDAAMTEKLKGIAAAVTAAIASEDLAAAKEAASEAREMLAAD